jgi:hypothetical protein
VTVETKGARVVHASAQAGAANGAAQSVADPGTPDLASKPTTRPARLPPPKIIPDGDKATLIYPCRHAETEALRAAVEVLLSPEGAIHASAALNSRIPT